MALTFGNLSFGADESRIDPRHMQELDLYRRGGSPFNEYQNNFGAFREFQRYLGQSEEGIGRLISDYRQNPFVQAAARQAQGLRGDVLGQLAQLRSETSATISGLRGDLLSGAAAQSAGAGAAAAQVARLQGGQAGMGGVIGRRAAADAAIGQSSALSGAIGQLGGLQLQNQQMIGQAGIQGLLGAGQISGGILSGLAGQENQLRGILGSIIGELGLQSMGHAHRQPVPRRGLTERLADIGQFAGGVGGLVKGIAGF